MANISPRLLRALGWVRSLAPPVPMEFAGAWEKETREAYARRLE